MELTQSRSGKGFLERVVAKLRAGAGEVNQVNGVECEGLQRERKEPVQRPCGRIKPST